MLKTSLNIMTFNLDRTEIIITFTIRIEQHNRSIIKNFNRLINSKNHFTESFESELNWHRKRLMNY